MASDFAKSFGHRCNCARVPGTCAADCSPCFSLREQAPCHLLSSRPLQAAAPGPAQIARDINAPALPLSTGGGPKGPTLLDQDGNEMILKGLSVFGFNYV